MHLTRIRDAREQGESNLKRCSAHTSRMTRTELQQHAEGFIRESLRRHLPEGITVYLFGSRARHTASWNADYDLWIDAELPRSTLQAILDEIDESFVPFKIDLVTTPDLSGTFAEQVRSEATRWM